MEKVSLRNLKKLSILLTSMSIVLLLTTKEYITASTLSLLQQATTSELPRQQVMLLQQQLQEALELLQDLPDVKSVVAENAQDSR